MKPSSSGPTRLRREGAPLLPATVLVGVVVAWAATGGGYESQPTLASAYEPLPWYGGALLLLGLLCATAIGLGRVRLSRPAAIAAAALALYAAWSFLSVLWAHDQGSAFLGSNRALVYLVAFLTFAILPWRAWSARAALWLLVAGVGALAVVTMVRLAAMGNPASLFINARLSYPLGYYNADAAMFMTVAATSIALCSRRDAHPALRVAGVVLAAICLQLALLGQSRGWLFTAPIVLLAALVLVPGRLRLLAFTLGPALAAAVVAPTLLHLYGHATLGGVALAEPRLGEILHREGVRAVHAMLIADAALALLALLAVIADRRISTGETAQRRLRWAGSALALAAVLAAVSAGLLATDGDPVGRLERAWSSFANTNNTANGSSRFTTLGSQRVDFWRVALHEFSRHPLAGIGQDNFAAPYLRERRTDQEPRWTHSIELRLLTHTGLIGALLFAAFLVVAVATAAGARRIDGARWEIAAIALLPLAVWLVHGSVDWLWEFPALSVPALAFAGLATALGSTRTATRLTEAGGRSMQSPGLAVLAARAAAALLALAALVALLLAFQSARRVQEAISVWPRQPGRAYAELRSAVSLLPFDSQPYLVGGAIALNLEDAPAARYWLQRALQRDRESWLAHFALGLLEGERGRLAAARAHLAAAAALNPRESAIALARRRLKRGRPLRFGEAQSLLALRQEQRFGR